jgi:carbon monoxide dehydrogenase subunit G
MAKIPTDVERSITVRVPLERAYAYLWDVVTSSHCIPRLASCTSVAPDTYRFVYEERSTGPISMVAQYTAHYEGNGRDRIAFGGTGATGDNTDVSGVISLRSRGVDATHITLRQHLAPDTPIPRLLSGLVHSFVERETSDGVAAYLPNVKRALEPPGV